MEAFLERLAPVWRPHAGQREFLLAPAAIRVLACGRRWGKTDACAVDVLAALHQPSPTRHLIVAPTQDQANLLFDRVRELLDALPDVEGVQVRRTPYPRLTYGPHRLTARSGHIGRSLRGNEATHVVMDEAAFVPEALLTEVAMPMLATTNGLLTLISTPNGLNHFWRFFRMGETGEHGIWSRRAPSAESPFVSSEFLAVQRRLISERAFAVEYEAQFQNAAGAVFRSEALEACFVAVPQPPPVAAVSIGVDWARSQDYTAVVAVAGSRDEAWVVHAEQFQGLSWTAQVERVAGRIAAFPGALVSGDSTGLGDPLQEALRDRIGRPVEDVTFTSAVKARLIEGLACMIDSARLRLPPNPELRRQLQHFEATGTPTERVRYGGAHGFHDDLVIALALAVDRLGHPPAGLLLGGPRRIIEP